MKNVKRNHLRWNSVIAALSVACLATALQACKGAPDADPTPVVAVEVEHPEVGSISEHILADATLTPLAQATISPKITAPVTRFYVTRGSHVKSGQLLATLESRDLVAQALDNKGQLSSAKAVFETQTKSILPEDEAKAERDVVQLKAALLVQKEITDARERLYRQGAISGHDYDTANAQLAQAQAAYDNARNHVAVLKASRQPVIEQSQGQLTSATGKYQAAQALVSYSEIRSPMDGVVTDRPLFPGETATTGSPLITVMDTSALIAKVHLSQVMAQRLHVGDAATVSIPGLDMPVPAKVSLISPALDPGSSTIEVWLRVENPSSLYKAGTPVRASIEGRTVSSAIKVPLSAVLTAQDGSKFVMVLRADEAAHKVSIQTGIEDGEDVQITSGLSGTESVITEGAYGLEDGTKVQVNKPGAVQEGK